MADGVSRDMNLSGPLEAMRQSLQGIRDELQRPVEIPVRVVGTEQARRELEGVQGGSPASIGDGRMLYGEAGATPYTPRDQDWILRPSHRRHHGAGAWDSPEDYPDASSDRLMGMASEGWDKIMGGGAYHTLQEAGRFGRKWGTFLDKDKAGEQRAWSDAAATPEGRSYMDSMEDTEKIGKKIAGLLREIGQGGHSAVRAAEEMKKAQRALEEVGDAGKKAADGLGGDMGGRLREELTHAQESASTGKAGADEGGGMNPRSILNMIRNPQGALMQGLEDGLLTKLSGLSPGAIGAIGVGGAVAGGAYLGWKFNAERASDAVKDGDAMAEDVRLSRSLGRNFDFRGAYWDENRVHAREGVDSIEGRRVLKSMGLGLDTFKGDVSGLTDRITRSSMDNGLESTELAGALGAAVNSGQVKRDQGSMEDYLQKMVGHLQALNSQGVTSGQALQAIASLNSQQVQALGRLTGGEGALNANLLEALTKTGDPALRGTQGASVLGRLGHVSGNQIPMVIGRAMQDRKGWDKLIHGVLGKDEAERFLAQDSQSQLLEASENPALVTKLQLEAYSSGEFHSTPGFARRNLLGMGNIPLSTLRKLDGITSPEDRDKMLRETRGETDHFNPNGSAIQRDEDHSVRSGYLKSREMDERITMASIEAAERMKGAAGDLREVSAKMSKALDDFQTGRGTPLTNPFDGLMATGPMAPLYLLKKFTR